MCCVFVYETSGSTITQNCSYIRNLNYPNSATDTSALAFTIQKCDSSKIYKKNITLLLIVTLRIEHICMHKYHEFYIDTFSGVCYLRLDFESFDINGLTGSIEAKDDDPKSVAECQDTFKITVIISN